MVTFCVPRPERGCAAFRFAVCGCTALLAGSRGHEVGEQTCRDILGGLARLGLGFYVGCDGGVDESFRRALSHSPWRQDAWIACTTRRRAWAARSLGLDALRGGAGGLSREVARYRCTLWMVRRCALAILFPDCRHDGDVGSGLAPGDPLGARQPEAAVHRLRASARGSGRLPRAARGPVRRGARLLGRGRSLRRRRHLR